MTTSFNVNVNDLQYILKQIKIAEASSAAYSATPKSILQAIMDAYGVTAVNAAQLPAGLRTVDGTMNNLLPGQGDFGAADTLFPRLTDPNFQNVNGPGIDFNGDGIVDVFNHNYGVVDVNPGPAVQLGVKSVADADPRTISNLIVDMTAGNTAAVYAALNHSVFTGAVSDADIPAAVAAIAAAFALTQATAATAAGITPAVLAALLATVNTEIGEQLIAQTNYNNALAADIYRIPAGLTATAQAAAQAVIDAINIVGSLIFNGAINQADIDAANAAVTAAQAAVNASNAAAAALTGLMGEGAAVTSASEALSLHGALVVYAGGLTLGEPVGAGDEIASISDAVATAEFNLGLAGDVTAIVTPLVDPGGLVALSLGLLNTANGELADAQLAYDNALNAGDAVDAAKAALEATLDSYGIEHDPLGSLVIPNLSPDIGLSPGFNEWMTYFGQFFDHGLDLVTKGNNGTVYIPLAADDPLYDKGADGIANNVVDAYFVSNPADAPVGGPLPAVSGVPTVWKAFYETDPADRTLYAPGAFAPVITATPTAFAVKFNDDGFGADGLVSTADDRPNFMALTRATATLDANGVPQTENTTTSWIDQNQTYTSHASHQVFLREYARVDTNGAAIAGGGLTVSTGLLIDGAVEGSIGNWGEVKAQALTMLGINLSDFDVHNVPLLLTDQYGKFIPGANGFAQLVMKPDGTHSTYWFKEGNPDGSVTTTGAETTGHAFLNDIAHHAAPGKYDANGDGFKESFQTADLDPGVGDDGLASTYDDEMLNAHFVTGDGRGNENIALTSVHSIFHSEHNRLVTENQKSILGEAQAKFASVTATAAEKAAALTFLNEWLVVDVPANATAADVAALTLTGPTALIWDGERLFQAARFATEMQYQHLVFEEFARRIQPMVDPFIFNSSPDIDPTIVAEFAHTVYRFGHSMLNGTVDRLDNNLDPVNGETDQETLLAAFLNPQMYLATGTTAAEINANLIRGLSRDVGNAIDEFIVVDVRSSLLGLPLDLAALNIARGRETGIPSLNETRKQLYEGASAPVADLKPYDNWAEFGAHLKNPMSLVNFVAAYGTHASITSVTELAAKRLAAQTLIDEALAGDNTNGAVDFIFGVGSFATSGLNDVDLWIGGLAEAHPEFGGMLGTTFNYIFEYQMEQLQFGDRMYYLTRTQGLNILNNLEPNTFSDLVMRNTELGDKYATHLNGALFVTPDYFLEMDTGIAQEDYNGLATAGIDPLWGAGEVRSPLTPSKVVRILGTDTDNTNGNVAGDGHLEGGTLRFTGGEHVVVGGTEGNDKIFTDKGIDTIWGDGGNDYINAGTESDDVFGGLGDDIIEDPFGDDVLRGNQGNDVISDARGANLIFGDEGSDYIMQGQDASEAFGGEGNDFILGGAGKDFLLGNEGDDWIEGGAGFDTIAGDNSELFFNSTVIGHDVLFHGGDEGDYDAESGDDIMGSGPSVFRYEGMFGFDWAIAKNDITGVDFDMAIPIFTTIANDILKDRFDQTEAFSGWKYNDVLQGDDRGHKGGGSSAPDSVPTELFADHLLTQEGINRIDGFNAWFGGFDGTDARQTLFGGASPVPGSTPVSTFRDGNILLGGDGNDALRGRGGYDLLDGDAYLNVRIKIVIPSGPYAGTYSAESMSTDTVLSGDYAGKVFNTNPDGSPDFASPAFGGATLNSLMLNGTINPGNMSIVREILDGTVNAGETDVDTAFFQGTFAEYFIEGSTDLNGDGDYNDAGEYTGAVDTNGDGFISVRDRDTGAVGALVDGVQLSSRGLLTDDHDLLKNIEQLQFADRLVSIAGVNTPATGTVTISDPTPYDGKVTPYVGQVLTATLSNVADLDGLTLDANGKPVGLMFEWQTTEFGSNSGWSTIVTTSGDYTVRSVDPGHVLRAVAVFNDADGNPERIISADTDNPTASFSVNENSLNGTVVGLQIPFSVDYDSQSINGQPPVDVDPATLWHTIDPDNNAGGRFTVIENGVDFNGKPRFSIVVDNGGPQLLNYEAPVHTPANQSHQFVDNQYQVVINTYSDNPANGGVLVAVRQFTILLNDVTGEIASIAPTLDLHTVSTVTGQYADTFNGTTGSLIPLVLPVASAANSSTGSTAWTSSWTETGDGTNDIRAGQIQIDTGILSSNNDLRFGAGVGAAITRTVNLNGATAASVSFNVDQNGLDNDGIERVTLQFSSDGVTFAAVSGGVIDSTSTSDGTLRTVTLPGPFTANSAIRFVSVGIDNGEDVRINGVQVNFTANTVGTPGNDYATSYTENDAGVAIASGPTITDADSTQLMGATVKLTNAQAGDVLSNGALPAGITASFGPAVAGQITMYLSGPATLAAFQTAIQAVRYSSTSEDPSTTPRTIQVSVNDGELSSIIATATVNVTAVADAMIANDDRVVTNIVNTAFVIPEWAFLNNDVDPDSALDITTVSNSIGLTGPSLATNPGSLTMTDSGTAGGSFTYTGTSAATANVAVARDVAGIIEGTNSASTADILVGDAADSTFDGGEGNDIIFAGAGDDTVLWNASGGNGNGPSDGHDIIDGGASATIGDRFVITGNNTAETFNIYTAAAAATAGLTGLNTNTEIVVTRNGAIIAELDNMEEITVNTFDVSANDGGGLTGGINGGDTVAVFGDFTTTSLNYNTITVNGSSADDSVDISGLTSDHRVVLNTGGGTDEIVGADRPQDIINVTSASSTDEDEDDDIEGDTSEYEDEDESDDDDADTGSGTPLAIIAGLNLIGDATSNLLAGADGDDVAMGNSGDDMLTTTGGSDMLFGGAGEDTLIAGAGNDMAYGEAGNDRLFAGDGNDMVDGGAGDDMAMGGSGDDLFIAAVNDGNDAYYGDAGTDTLNMSAIIDRIEANLGTGFNQSGFAKTGSSYDTLWNVENIVTGGGNDKITASSAHNVIDTGAGQDTVVFRSASDADGDTILNFQAGDKIDISGFMGAVRLVNGSTAAAGEIAMRFESIGGENFTVLEGHSTTGDQFKIDIKGHHILTGTDFAS